MAETDQGRGWLWRELALHAVVWLASVGILVSAYRLYRCDLRYPLTTPAGSDGLYYSTQVKILLETGWVFEHPGLGAPYGLQLYDFPQFDAMHLLVMKLLGYVFNDWAVVLNVFYLLTFPLTATTALLLFRHLGFGAPLALVLALLFAFQPFHFDRCQGHIMLGAYYHVPLLLFAMVWLLSPLGLRDSEDVGLWRSRRFWLAAGLAFLGAFGGHYYAAFACITYLAAALYSAARDRAFAPAYQAGLLCAAAVLGGAVNLAPNFVYWAREGPNREVSAKSPAMAEVYALRLTPTLLPASYHRVKAFRSVANYYYKSSVMCPSWPSSVGLVAGAGILALLACAVFRLGDSRTAGFGVVALTLFLFLIPSGFGALFAYLVTPQWHGLERGVIFLALFGLTTVGFGAAWLQQHLAGWAWHPAVVVLGVLGLADVVPHGPPRPPEDFKAQFLAHKEFAHKIQTAVPAGSTIHLLPTPRFPLGDYSDFVTYLYTTGLRWTVPVLLNRESAAWLDQLEKCPADRYLAGLVDAGITGLVLDVSENSPLLARAVKVRLVLAGLVPIKGPGGQLFFDLRELATRAPVESAQRLAEAGPVHVSWSGEVQKEERDGSRPGRGRWCVEKVGRGEIVNAHEAPVKVRLSMRLHAARGRDGFRLVSPLLKSGQVDARDGEEVSSELVVPPGAHTLTIISLGNDVREGPHKTPCFRIEGLRVRVEEGLQARR